MTRFRFSTIASRAGMGTDEQYHSVVPPLYLSTNFVFPALEQLPPYDYTRSGHPNRDILQQALTQLEHGAGAVATNCGTSAINLWLSAFLQHGSLIIAPHDCYGGTHRLLTQRAKKGDFEVCFIDQGDKAQWQESMERNPSLILIETPSNPLLRVVDIGYICQKAHQVGALVAVDNTFLTPIWQTPLQLGADFVIHSTTKYINGHSDVIGGVVIAKSVDHAELLSWWGNCLGATASPFDCNMTLRGLRTLESRMHTHEKNAKALLAYLKDHTLVGKIYHPSLPENQGHQIATIQQSGFGAMLSFEFKGTQEQLVAFLNALRLFLLAESFGGVESLICHPASMTHRAMGEDALARAGISANLLRLSIGLEHHQDLIEDLDQAFDTAKDLVS